jgi:glycosyltransferase involved in cell wall biosynthesis
VLDHITPVLLTYNEEANIAGTLSGVQWARDIVVVDSGSTDGTRAILEKFPNVRLFTRAFDTHANQWRFAVEETQIGTEWILRLDADYRLSATLIAELARLDPNAAVSAYRIGFDYAVFSKKLLSSLYPANTILLRKGRFSVRDAGHTEAWDVAGPVASLSGRITHDDWKSTKHWVVSQSRYMERELAWLRTAKDGVARWLRLRPPLMPIAMFVYCLFGKGLVFNGRAGLFYALQRMTAEAVLSLLILEEKLRTCAAQPALEERERK